MNTKEQADQLRLAADIIETGHPFQFRDGSDGKWVKADVATPFDALAERLEIRPILATPPDGRALHNPGNLTAEQVGVGKRLPLEDESANQPHELWDKIAAKWVKAIPGSYTFEIYPDTYRLPLSVPWPEAPKPESTFQLPQPPPGMQGHRTSPLESDHILGWRYAEPVTTVQLGPSDVPPGSVFRGGGEAKDPDYKGWCLITSCSMHGIRYWRHYDPGNQAELTWRELHESGAQINRPANRDAEGNPTKWEPCSKEVAV